MTFSEILDLIQRYTNTKNSTSSSYPIDAKTVDVNNALNKFMLLAMLSEGKWEVDDSNQTDYPIITTGIIQGQQDYSFTTDADGNQILDIYKVRIKDQAGNWTTLRQISLQSGDNTPFGGGDDYLNSTVQSIPSRYRLTANGIFLIDIPNFSQSASLEVYINRTPTYFLTTDTSKKAGIPWTFHEYLAIRPAYYYCLEKGLPQTTQLGGEMLRMEEMIGEYYAKRNKDQPNQILPVYRNSR